MSQLYRVVYCSRNHLSGAPATYPAEIEAILATSRINNARDGITGGLLFNDGCFAQALEGPIDAVEAAFERIQCDDRHGDVTVIETGLITARDFPDWSMAFNGNADDANPWPSRPWRTRSQAAQPAVTTCCGCCGRSSPTRAPGLRWPEPMP